MNRSVIIHFSAFELCTPPANITAAAYGQASQRWYKGNFGNYQQAKTACAADGALVAMTKTPNTFADFMLFRGTNWSDIRQAKHYSVV